MRAKVTLLPDVTEIHRGNGEKGAFLFPSERCLWWKAENAALMWVWRVSVRGVTLEEHFNSLKGVVRETFHQQRNSFQRRHHGMRP